MEPQGQFMNHKVGKTRQLALHLERLEDRCLMDGAGFIHTNPTPDPGSVVGVAAIEAQDDYVETWLAAGELRIDVLLNDPVPTGSTALTIKSVSETLRGATVTISEDGTRLIYTAPSGGFSFDTFYYIVEDGAGKLGKANVNIGRKYESTGGTYNPPVGNSDYFILLEDSPPEILDVLQNDGVDGSAEIIEVSVPGNLGGTVTITPDGKKLLYQPPAGKSGSDSFTYTYRLSSGSMSTIVVFVDAVKPYQPRSSSDYVYHVGTGSIILNVMDDDWVRGPTAEQPRIVEVSQPEVGGTLSISEDGRHVLYSPAAGFIGAISFTYTVRYGPAAHQTAVSSENVQIHNSFLAVDNWFAVGVDSGASVLNVLANDPILQNWKLPNVSLTVAEATTGSHGGQVSISADNKIVYTPAVGFTGDETFTYTVRDSNGRLDTAKVTIHVANLMADAGVPKFILPGELKQFLIDQAVERFKHQFGVTQQTYVGPVDAIDHPYFYAMTTNDAVLGRSSDHSKTNTQESGVDEADIVETDGQFVYTFSHGKLVIVDVENASNPELVSFTSFDASYDEMYLQGDRMTLIHRGYGKQNPSLVTVVDVSDRRNPTVLVRTEITGRIVDSRAVGDRVYVAVSGMELPALESSLDIPAPTDGYYELRTFETVDEYVARLHDTLIQDSLPTYRTYNTAGVLVSSGLVTDPTQIHKPIDAVDNELLSLVTFDIADGQPGVDSSAGIFTTGAAQVYMSGSSFYVMRNTGNETAIFRFAIDNDGVASLAATGKFDGFLLNQFSVDEHEGRLRIATTQIVNETYLDQYGIERFRQQRRFNNLLVLEQNGVNLEIVGSITNLAPTETIKSVRFLDDRAYVTTFRIVDPLFTVDLTDPTSPQVTGALKIPGFSDYLHPVGEDYVIGIGRDASEITGALGPLQISLFYVGGAVPALVDQVTLDGVGWHSSEAWFDHHAVSYFAEDQALTIPISWNEPITDGILTGESLLTPSMLTFGGTWRQFSTHSAIWAFAIETDGAGGGSIDVSGSVEHETDSAGYSVNSARRSVRVGDALITLSNDYLKINSLQNVGEQLSEVYLGTLPRDDHYTVEGSAGAITLNVRANDRPGIAGAAPLIVSVTEPESSWRWYGGIDARAAVDFVTMDSIFSPWSSPVEPGTVAISADGRSIIFTPNPEFVGTATFDYTVIDELRGEQTATVTVTVTGNPSEAELVLVNEGEPLRLVRNEEREMQNYGTAVIFMLDSSQQTQSREDSEMHLEDSPDNIFVADVTQSQFPAALSSRDRAFDSFFVPVSRSMRAAVEAVAGELAAELEAVE